MDGNKDAAQNCFEIGNQALKDGYKLRAQRFFLKAQRLDPTLDLGGLLATLAEKKGHQKQELKDSQMEPEASSSGAQASSCNGNGDHKAASPQYTSEQVEIVRWVRKIKDYYQILGLERECSAEEVKKAYRKVSLKVHPDKNKAPGADEAFKAVSKAFACLNEPEARKKYDQYGPEDVTDAPWQCHRNGSVYEDMFDADDIFNAFFYGTPYKRAHFVRTQRAAGGGGQRVHTREVGGMMGLLQLLPVLALFLFSLFPFLLSLSAV